MRGDIEELERRRTAEHREVAHGAFEDETWNDTFIDDFDNNHKV